MVSKQKTIIYIYIEIISDIYIILKRFEKHMVVEWARRPVFAPDEY